MGACFSSSKLSSLPGERNITADPTPKFDSHRSWSWRKSIIEGGRNKEAVEGRGLLDEEQLHSVRGRKCFNGSSERTCLFTRQGKKGTNQDAMIVWEDFASREDTIFCGVFDGHGPYGHMVARKVRDSLPLKLCNQWKAMSSDESILRNSNLEDTADSEETAFISIGVNKDEFPEMYFTVRQSLLEAFNFMDEELKLYATTDCFCSGTTAVTLIKKGQDLVIGNIGDSRAVLGTRDKENSLVAVQLTVDLKPNLPSEAARIQQCKGRVFALQDEPNVVRVWLPKCDAPGLAMSRAFGDFCLKHFGLISVPEITYHHVTDRDEFVILATDGVWDVFTNQEVIDIVASAPTRATAARAVVDSAVRAWRLKFSTSKIDDCAVVCLFLNPTSSSIDEITADPHKTSNGTRKTLSSTTYPRPYGAEEEQPSVPNYSQYSSMEEHIYIPAGLDEVLPLGLDLEVKDDGLAERCQSTRSLADCLTNREEEEWSALEGVTRVNSLVTLPRQIPGGDEGSTIRR